MINKCCKQILGVYDQIYTKDKVFIGLKIRLFLSNTKTQSICRLVDITSDPTTDKLSVVIDKVLPAVIDKVLPAVIDRVLPAVVMDKAMNIGYIGTEYINIIVYLSLSYWIEVRMHNSFRCKDPFFTVIN